MNQSKPPEDLAAAIAEVLRQTASNAYYSVNPANEYDEFIATAEDYYEEAHTILRLCEAAALAALPEMTLQDAIKAKMFPTPEEYEKMVWAINWYKATAQANIHSVFGGSNA